MKTGEGCGCHPQWDDFPHNRYWIDFCPLHAAAEEMLAALNEADALIDRFISPPKNRKDWNYERDVLIEDSYAYLVRRKARIEKAEGRGAPPSTPPTEPKDREDENP